MFQLSCWSLQHSVLRFSSLLLQLEWPSLEDDSQFVFMVIVLVLYNISSLFLFLSVF
jgi:hypothetical protein